MLSGEGKAAIGLAVVAQEAFGEALCGAGYVSVAVLPLQFLVELAQDPERVPVDAHVLRVADHIGAAIGRGQIEARRKVAGLGLHRQHRVDGLSRVRIRTLRVDVGKEQFEKAGHGDIRVLAAGGIGQAAPGTHHLGFQKMEEFFE